MRTFATAEFEIHLMVSVVNAQVNTVSFVPGFFLNTTATLTIAALAGAELRLLAFYEPPGSLMEFVANPMSVFETAGLENRTVFC